MEENKDKKELADLSKVEPTKTEENKVVDGTGNNTKKPFCIYNNVNITIKTLNIVIIIGVLVVFGAIIIGVLTK